MRDIYKPSQPLASLQKEYNHLKITFEPTAKTAEHFKITVDAKGLVQFLVQQSVKNPEKEAQRQAIDYMRALRDALQGSAKKNSKHLLQDSKNLLPEGFEIDGAEYIPGLHAGELMISADDAFSEAVAAQTDSQRLAKEVRNIFEQAHDIAVAAPPKAWASSPIDETKPVPRSLHTFAKKPGRPMVNPPPIKPDAPDITIGNHKFISGHTYRINITMKPSIAVSPAEYADAIPRFLQLPERMKFHSAQISKVRDGITVGIDISVTKNDHSDILNAKKQWQEQITEACRNAHYEAIPYLKRDKQTPHPPAGDSGHHRR